MARRTVKPSPKSFSGGAMTVSRISALVSMVSRVINSVKFDRASAARRLVPAAGKGHVQIITVASLPCRIALRTVEVVPGCPTLANGPSFVIFAWQEDRHLQADTLRRRANEVARFTKAALLRCCASHVDIDLAHLVMKAVRLVGLSLTGLLRMT